MAIFSFITTAEPSKHALSILDYSGAARIEESRKQAKGNFHGMGIVRDDTLETGEFYFRDSYGKLVIPES